MSLLVSLMQRFEFDLLSSNVLSFEHFEFEQLYTQIYHSQRKHGNDQREQHQIPEP